MYEQPYVKGPCPATGMCFGAFKFGGLAVLLVCMNSVSFQFSACEDNATV